jgi:dipeptidyl aminopeptidase/acylaminoacyl peptidase
MAQFAQQAIFSPDGRYFVTVTQRGLLPQGHSEATLWLFDTSTIRHSIGAGTASSTVAPISLARLTATINGGGVLGGGVILRPTWAADSKSVLFLGRDGHENRQLFRVRLSDGNVVVLSPPTQDVVDFGSAGNNVVYFAGPDIPSEKLWWSNDPSAPDIVMGTGHPLIGLLYPNYGKNGRDMPTEFEVWRVHGTQAQPVIEESTHEPMRILGSYNVSALSLSTDGARMIGITNVDQVPALWERYALPKGLDIHPFRADSGTDRGADYSRALQYQEFDFEKGTRRPLLGAPLADYQRGGIDHLQAVWSPDERYVAVSGTYLPLDKDNDTHQFTGQCAVAVVDRQRGGVECLIDRSKSKAAPIQLLSWADAGQRLLVSYGATGEEFKRERAHWKLTRSHVPTPAAVPLELAIRQTLDEPPALFAKAGRGQSEHKIFDPNPQLAALTLGSVSPYDWTDARGRSLHGLLAKPLDFERGRRYPLVIQTHGFWPHQFFRVGYSETANAGRALAGRGMLVLQVDEPEDEFGTWREGTVDGTEVYVAAIDQLVKEGLVDPTKVGITGYSRSGFYVARAITDSPDRFAAAAIANADPGSLIGYETYIDYAMPTYAQNAANAFAGALPYGDGLKEWLERAPGFRTDRIHAPVLISAADPQHLISLWGIYAPLRDQGKPVELQYFRSGQHNLTKPLQIFAHQEMLVDWFDFWLNGHEDSDSTKSSQYARWRTLKKLPAIPENAVVQ